RQDALLRYQQLHPDWTARECAEAYWRVRRMLECEDTGELIDCGVIQHRGHKYKHRKGMIGHGSIDGWARIKVSDPEKLSTLQQVGTGRQRAFGFGLVLVEEVQDGALLRD